jgi:hypothetical protein
MEALAELPDDMVFFTQITMEAAEDPDFLDAMRKANIKGALVGVESVTSAGLKDVYKGFNLSGDELVTRLREFRKHGVHVLGSFIFGLPSDREDTFDATLALAGRPTSRSRSSCCSRRSRAPSTSRSGRKTRRTRTPRWTASRSRSTG